MKKRIFKTAIAVILMLSLVAMFASCGNTSATLPDAESAEGEIDGTDIEWEYDKDDKTLTVTGSGAIPDCEASEDVWWYDVRHSVENLDISDGITSIGNYAFYYFPALEDVDIPASVTSIGDLAFAFCSSLEAIELPDALTHIGESCFEACTSLEGIFVPATVTTLGARAFAHCASMKTAILMAQITELGTWTFKSCSSLEKVCFNESARSMTVSTDAFEDAALGYDKAEFTASLTGDATLTINYVYENGETAADTYTETLSYGESYSKLSPTIEGYEADELTVSGVITDFNTVRTVTYKAVAAETEAEAEGEEQTEPTAEDDSEGISVGTIIAIVVFALVIVAIIVLVIFMIRSDKKQNAQSTKGRSSKKK